MDEKGLGHRAPDYFERETDCKQSIKFLGTLELSMQTKEIRGKE